MEGLQKHSSVFKRGMNKGEARKQNKSHMTQGTGGVWPKRGEAQQGVTLAFIKRILLPFPEKLMFWISMPFVIMTLNSLLPTEHERNVYGDMRQTTHF